MAIIKQSFLSNLFGKDNYDTFKENAKIIIAIGTCILSIILIPTFIFHWNFLSSLLNLVTGTSLLFLIYVAALVIVLDIEVEIEQSENSNWPEPQQKESKPIAYKLTIVWGIMLIVLGISAIYFSNKYREYYAFKCNTFLVDHQKGIYHSDWDNDCEVAAESINLEKMKGYQIEESYTFCEWCEEWEESVEYDYDIYHRR